MPKYFGTDGFCGEQELTCVRCGTRIDLTRCKADMRL